jgi:4a-hydroxytetrahydrobiopterin dehydratase
MSDIDMSDLAARRCIPCSGDTPRLRGDELRGFLERLESGWQVVEEHHLVKRFDFPDFAQALAFTNRIGEVAESEGHHPEILLGWGKVEVTIWTHAIDGLSESDVILAAKVDALQHPG